MRPIHITTSISNPSNTAFASAVTGSSFTLISNEFTSEYVKNKNEAQKLAHKIIITNNSSTNHSTKTVIITGIDQDGNEQTETINLPGSNGTSDSTKYYRKLTSVVPSDSIGSDTMKIGVKNEICTPTFPQDYANYLASNIAINIKVFGTINYTVQQTLDEIQTLDRDSIDFANSTESSIVNSTSNGTATYVNPPKAIRAVINSYTYSGNLDFEFNIVP